MVDGAVDELATTKRHWIRRGTLTRRIPCGTWLYVNVLPGCVRALLARRKVGRRGRTGRGRRYGVRWRDLFWVGRQLVTDGIPEDGAVHFAGVREDQTRRWLWKTDHWRPAIASSDELACSVGEVFEPTDNRPSVVDAPLPEPCRRRSLRVLHPQR